MLPACKTGAPMVYLFSSVEMDFDGTWVSFCFVFGLSLQVCV